MGQRLLETDPMAQMRILTQMAQARQREMANQQRLGQTIPAGAGALAGQLPGILQ
jgi:hypothetical protein